ncbi:MAG: transposase [Bacteroidaceae bacterium]|nr:transposase [Bacteroidaceae bacterium]
MKNNDSCITYNVEMVFPNEDCRSHFAELLQQVRSAYNECTKIICEKGIPLDIKSVHNVVYSHLRSNFAGLTSNAVIAIYRTAMGNIRSIRSNGHKDAKIPEKKQLSHKLNRFLYSHLTANGIMLTTNTKRIRSHVTFKTYPKLVEMFKRYVSGDPTIFVRNGKFYMSIPFKVPETPLVNDNCIGVDLGERRFAVTSDGIMFNDKEYNARRRKLRYIKRCLQKKGTKSARKHKRKLSVKERNQSTDMCRRMSNAIIGSTDSSIIILEDLSNIKQKTAETKEGFKKKNHNRRIGQVPFFKFKQILSYKALLNGKRVETVSPFMTSQTDCTNGKKDGTRKNRRFYCKNGTVLDADWNAAINIAQKSKHPFSFKMPIDGALRTWKAGCVSATQSYVSLPSGSITSSRPLERV